MSENVKKKWSKKKKALVIVLSVLLLLIAAVVCTGLYVLNSYCQTKDYTIVSVDAGEDVNLIAHRGFRAVAPENTAPAFEEAGNARYYGAECDTYRTKDGVWIISHDSYTYRMMDKNAKIENKTYDELMSYKTDNGSNIDKYTDLGICSLEEYLNICKKYGMIAVIELKGPNNTEHYDEIINLVNKTGAQAMYISFHIDNLRTIRSLDADARLWYLAKAVTDEDIADAKSLGGKCGIDFDASKEENTKELVDKCVSEGLEVGAWTVDDIDTYNRLIKMGVKNITTDCITY